MGEPGCPTVISLSLIFAVEHFDFLTSDIWCKNGGTGVPNSDLYPSLIYWEHFDFLTLDIWNKNQWQPTVDNAEHIECKFITVVAKRNKMKQSDHSDLC